MKKLLIILCGFLLVGCNSQKKDDPKLIGKWEGMLKDSENSKGIEKVVLEFKKDGQFLQFVGEGKSQNIIKSSYKIEGEKILAKEEGTTEQANSKYLIKNDTLTIIYEGIENKYLKINK